jgi:hypothetical protein
MARCSGTEARGRRWALAASLDSRELRVGERRIKSIVRVALAAVVAITAFVALPAASAKEFDPGDVRICNSRHCVPVVNRQVLPLLASFYGRPTPRVSGPRLGVPYYELRYRNGYVTGIIAARGLDRFLSYGVNLDRFSRDQWYRVPDKLSREFRRLTGGLRPLRLSRVALARSR